VWIITDFAVGVVATYEKRVIITKQLKLYRFLADAKLIDVLFTFNPEFAVAIYYGLQIFAATQQIGLFTTPASLYF
jgi:hypothetical protein